MHTACVLAYEAPTVRTHWLLTPWASLLTKTSRQIDYSMSSHAHVPHVHVPRRHPHHPDSEKPLLDDVDLAGPLHTGYMYKEAHSHVVFHKRFFVLFPRVLVYYEKESDYKRDVARGNLEHRHKAIALEGLYLSKPEKRAKGAKFCFILHAPDKTNERCDFLLVTETREDRKQWIEALQDQNPDLLSSEHHHHLHSKLIHPDTPQTSRKNGKGHAEEVVSAPEQSITSISSTTSQREEDVPNLNFRPGSPRHDLDRLSSSGSTTDHLDIQHLNIREGPSDTEDTDTH